MGYEHLSVGKRKRVACGNAELVLFAVERGLIIHNSRAKLDANVLGN